LKWKSVCAGHEALMAAAAAAISEAESGARGCERSVFAICGVTGSIDIFKIVLSNTRWRGKCGEEQGALLQKGGFF
jgi:hypothetical protein